MKIGFLIPVIAALSLLSLGAKAEEVPKSSAATNAIPALFVSHPGLLTRSTSTGTLTLLSGSNFPALITCGSVSMPLLTTFPTPNLANPLIDYDGFLDGAKRVGEMRKTHRVPEDEFRLMCEDPSTVILDARSASKFEKLHVKRAVNLSLPDFTADELEKIIPSKSTRVLIYCNNNFSNAPGEFPAKVAVTSLNINTFNTLVGYGYTNVFELGPLLDIRTTAIPFEGTSASQIQTFTKR